MARKTVTPSIGLRALVLHGDAAAQRDLSRALESRCFSVISASDGTRGLELLLEELLSLDVVVIDAALPHRDARAFVELIRCAGGEGDLAIVVLAHDASPQGRAALLARGVDAVIRARSPRRSPRPRWVRSWRGARASSTRTTRRRSRRRRSLAGTPPRPRWVSRSSRAGRRSSPDRAPAQNA